jgi:diguanylate cyclase (GGDEF)-like protein
VQVVATSNPPDARTSLTARLKARRGTLLVIDDSATARALVLRTVEAQGLFERVVQAKNGREGLEKAAECRPDVVLSDNVMPELDGYGFVSEFRKVPENEHTPVLILSSEGDTESRLKCFQAGANDYVNKPFHPLELGARLANYLKLKLSHDDLERAYQELESSNEKLERLAATDGLTGLCNRRHFLTRADDELSRALRYSHTVGFILIDIDHFKSINDGWGHPAGDRTLIEVASVLSNCVRRSDLVARFGGEEFIVMLPETNGEGARAVADKLLSTARERVIPGLDPRRVTLSAGIALYDDAHRSSLDAVIQRADQALYRAKQGGRDRAEMAADQ